MKEEELTKLKFAGDPVEYVFSFNFNAICDAEEATNSNLLVAMQRPRLMTAQQFRGLALAALKTRHSCTLEEVGALISQHTAEVGDALAKVYGWEPTPHDAVPTPPAQAKDPGSDAVAL